MYITPHMTYPRFWYHPTLMYALPLLENMVILLYRISHSPFIENIAINLQVITFNRYTIPL